MELSFIIIDDTELDHFIAKKMITNTNAAFYVQNFLEAGTALEFIINDNVKPGIKLTLVFLDIYMPVMNGFEFMEEFEKLDAAIQDKYYIVALTSSIEVSDINRINAYNLCRSVIHKPLTSEDISNVLKTVVRDFNIELL